MGNISKIVTNNIAVGTDALKSLEEVTSKYNIAIGNNSMEGATAGIDNIAIGRKSLKSGRGSYNIAIGTEAIESNTIGDYNIAIGKGTMKGNTTGSYNIAIGGLGSNTTGSTNIAIKGLGSNTTGSINVAIGGLGSNTTGSRNVAIGGLNSNITGHYNTAIGVSSGEWIKGNGNTQLGTGSSIGHIGYTSELDNVVAIGNGFGDLTVSNGRNNTILLGDKTTSPIVGIGTYKPVTKLDVAGAVKVGDDTSTCTANLAGAIRFNSTNKKFQGCDGSSWVNLGS